MGRRSITDRETAEMILQPEYGRLGPILHDRLVLRIVGTIRRTRAQAKAEENDAWEAAVARQARLAERTMPRGT
jgi:hypothetical protein